MTTPIDDLLVRIRNVCNDYPENFVAGYIVSLIEGNPNEEILKSWQTEAEAKARRDTITAPRSDSGDTDTTQDPIGDDAREGSKHTDPSARVDDQPSSDTRLGELEPDGGTNVRRHGRAPDPKHNHRKTKRTTKKDVKTWTKYTKSGS